MVLPGPSPSLIVLPIYIGVNVNVTYTITWFLPNHDMVSRRICTLSMYGEHAITLLTNSLGIHDEKSSKTNEFRIDHSIHHTKSSRGRLGSGVGPQHCNEKMSCLTHAQRDDLATPHWSCFWLRRTGRKKSETLSLHYYGDALLAG